MRMFALHVAISLWVLVKSSCSLITENGNLWEISKSWKEVEKIKYDIGTCHSLINLKYLDTNNSKSQGIILWII